MHPVNILVEGSSATINYRMWTVMIVYVHVHDLVNVHILYLLLFSVWRDLQLPLSCIWQSDGWGSGRRIRVRERRRRGGRWRRGGGGGLLLNWFFFQICYLQFLLQCLVAYDDFILQGLKSYFVQTYLIWIDG